MDAVRTAVPLLIATGLVRRAKVQLPAGKDIAPAASTTQPLQVAGSEGAAGPTVEYTAVVARPVPGTKSDQPTPGAPVMCRVSAWGSAAPLIAPVSRYDVAVT